MSAEQQLIEGLEDLFDLLKKAKINYRKCPKGRISTGYLQARITCIEEYWSSFRTNHKNLIKVTTKDSRLNLEYFKQDMHSQFEELYLDFKAELSDTLENSKSVKNDAANASTNVQESSRSSDADINLPKINLPLFSGAYEEWQSFEDVFISLIHRNKKLSDVQKLHYLKSCVMGEAKNTIKNFKITDKNYNEAWETLRNRYNHKRLIVDAVLKKLFSLKRNSTQSANQLKTLIDNTNECISSLHSLDITTVSWDPLIVFLTTQKLDPETHKEWEKFVSKQYKTELPTFKSLVEFLESNIQTLVLTSQTSSTRAVKERTFHTVATKICCSLCKENHFIFNCKEYGKLSPEKRRDHAKDHRLCYNCLSSSHPVFNCKQKTCCKICGRRHHSLLHCYREEKKGEFGKKERDSEGNKESTGLSAMHTRVEEGEEENQDVSIASHLASSHNKVLLATALILAKGHTGETTMLRALIDPGSQASFVSARVVQLLRLKKMAIRGTVSGVGSTTTKISHMVEMEIFSRYNKDYKLAVKAFVLTSHITTRLPYRIIEPNQKWSYLNGLELADPQYYIPSKIDLLLGVEAYTDILRSNLVKGPPGSPTAQDTHLGWILFGNIGNNAQDNEIIVMHHTLQIDLNNMLKTLWEIEDTGKRNYTAEERNCEEIYKTNQTRSTDGKYIVKLPFKTSPEEIGNTKDIALKRFYNLERKLNNNKKLKEEYKKVIQEYIQLNHMELVPEDEKNKHAIYLPHHAVIKEDSESTKIRIVFDASCKGSNNKSLNDLLMIGPQLQEDLRSIVMRWRIKPICFIADIEKMYRMILVTNEDADYQRILWRMDPNENISEYRILRITFGTASAPYLAVKTLTQLAKDEEKDYPEAAKIIMEDFYVDDCISGCFTLAEAIKRSQQLREVLRRGGFELKKWASNNDEFLKTIKPELRSTKLEENTDKGSIIKTLGITWNIKTDCFQYDIKLPQISELITKRKILADIQHLFDPLGWLSPIIILAKMLIQRMWMERLDWDEYVGESIKDEWLRLRSSFGRLKEIKIKRWIYTEKRELNNISLHGFSDASSKAYCAVVYFRVMTSKGEVKTGIIASKTRVAPLKPLSLPRLELCGAVLLARLLTLVKDAMRIPLQRIYAWTDSTVVLSWLCGDPNRWKPFVSNRVVEVIDHIGPDHWFHVKSKDNPADIGSRGSELSQLIKNSLWWKGPEWLKEKKVEFCKPNLTPTEEERKGVEVNFKIEEDKKNLKFDQFDSLEELLRVIVYCVRFLNFKKMPKKLIEPITTDELQNALLKCIQTAQREEYEEEIQRLKNNKGVRQNSNIKSLNPYLDKHDILRVGGRLRNSDLSDERKHPIIIGNKNTLTYLIVVDAHKKTLHGGIQLMTCYIRSKYWLIRGKNTIKKVIHNCIVCTRHKAMTRSQVMGDLPTVRTTPARPFLHSGVDFAGPLQVLMSRGRGAKSHKAYIAIFICMATKALHLELVGDLTSESFIAAFRRFVSRRGRCNHIWSDQGRNFVGSNKQLAEAWKEAKLELPGHVSEILSSDGTQWHFIPPYTPHFGGLWEAGVKSIKYHLRRILTSHLTFEELTTLLCQIEACLNSRPLTPIDTTDTELEVLTPGHFLIGEAPITVPSPDLRNVNVSHLSRWQHSQRLLNIFWHRWQNEYLSRLQERPKWIQHQKEFDIGDIVLVKDELLPPGKWPLGRIVDKHPGSDNITRVYSVKCKGDVIKRNITKLCALPIVKD